MLSERKGLIRVFELAALVGSIVGLALGALVHLKAIAPSEAQPIILVTFVANFFVFGFAVWLAGEYTSTVRAGQSFFKRARGLSFAEIRGLVLWCPKALIIFTLVGVPIGFVVMLVRGGVHWSEGQAFTDHEAIGFAVGASLFYLLALPVLASAARMPGDFARFFSNNANTGI